MRWHKLGNIFDPQRHRDWAGSHAQVPTVIVKEQVLRIYYADRHASGQSFATYLDVDRADPTRVVYMHKRSILPYGKPGTFDDEGIMPASAVTHEGRIYLYYSGWNRRVTVPYHNATGVAVSDDGGDTYTRLFDGPILDRIPQEPYLAVTPSVLKEGDNWQMWYVSGLEWVEIAGKYEPVYAIKYGHATDGLHWQRPLHLVLPQRHPREAMASPSVLKTGDLYRMWYCYRDSDDYRDGKGSYRIGYAESDSGSHFTRQDERVGITVSETGWDSTMICYPCVIAVDGKTYMFYNGNSFGQTGMGVALLEE